MGGEMPFKDDDTRREHFRKRYNSLRQKWLAANGPCRHCGSWDDLDVDRGGVGDLELVRGSTLAGVEQVPSSVPPMPSDEDCRRTGEAADTRNCRRV